VETTAFSHLADDADVAAHHLGKLAANGIGYKLRYFVGCQAIH
jgi:hypothetical protein